MANEGTLKQKWLRNARKQGLYGKSLSPHQIPGMPDIIVMDKGITQVTQETRRARCWWLEAKVCDPGPFAFKASRDATPQQTRWELTFNALGQGTGWLILGDDRWMYAPADELVVTRETFQKKARPYSDPATYRPFRDEIETRRAPFVRATEDAIESIEQRVLKLYAKD